MSDVVANAEASCPQCGGVIKAAAKVCKHCGRPVEGLVVVVHQSSGSTGDRVIPHPLAIIMVASLLLAVAPGFVRLGPSRDERFWHEQRATCWRALVDTIDPADAVLLPGDGIGGHPCTTEATSIASTAVDGKRAELSRQWDRFVPDPTDFLSGRNNFRQAGLLPKVVTWSEIYDEAGAANARVEYDTGLMAIGASGAFVLVALGALLAGLLARQVGRLDGAALEHPRLRRAALPAFVASAVVGLTAVAWLVINAGWLPDFAVFASAGVLFGAAPLWLVGRRLRRGQDARRKDMRAFGGGS